jgi:RNA polymerase sigma-70 factor (ECF subfamily)
VRAPLILQTVLGLDAARIASSFLVSPASMSQRLVRAKTKIREAGIAFAVPEKSELPARLEPVLDAIYGAFAEGWNDPARADAARRDLADEAIYLGLLIAELLPDEPEVLGLSALMLHAEARREARRDSRGTFIPFDEQDLARWNRPMIARAEGFLARAGKMERIGRYQLEAALQSAHVARRVEQFDNWDSILRIYDALFELTGSPVVAINRALALSEVSGANAALDSLRAFEGDLRLKTYQPYWAARATLLARTGREAEARAAFDIAIGLEKDPAVRAFLQVQREQCRQRGQ